MAIILKAAELADLRFELSQISDDLRRKSTQLKHKGEQLRVRLQYLLNVDEKGCKLWHRQADRLSIKSRAGFCFVREL